MYIYIYIYVILYVYMWIRLLQSSFHQLYAFIVSFFGLFAGAGIFFDQNVGLGEDADVLGDVSTGK